MNTDVRRAALAFLVKEQLLTPVEAEEALAVAADVLRAGLDRLAGAADGPACAEAAHSLKGNFLNLGLPELAQNAQQIWELAGRDDTAKAKAIGAALRQALAPLLAPHSD